MTDQPVPPTATGDSANASDKGETIPKARLDAEIEKRRGLEGELKALADEMAADVPDNLKPLIPDLSPAARVKWIRDARKAGLFGAAAVPTTDTGKPRTTPRDADLTKLPAVAKIAAAYARKA